MIIEQKEIRYKDKIIFERLVMSKEFLRVPKVFEEDESCFLFLTKGAFRFRTPTNLQTLKEGDAMLAKCGNYLMENIGIDQRTENQMITVIGAFFYPNMVKGFFGADLSLAHFQKTFDIKKVDIEPLLKSYIDSINFMLDHPEIADENLVVTKLKELLILLSKGEGSISIQEFINDLFVPYRYDFKDIIQQNLYTNLSVAELAYLCHMSLATFKRRFKAMYGQSPAKYFFVKKLERACQLLLLEAMSITEVALECGFETVSNFDRAFKRQYGTTPTEFRLEKKGH